MRVSNPGCPDDVFPGRIRELANAVRALTMDAVEEAASGHPGMPMGMADVATVLFARHLRFDPSTPDWPDRDRFVLSAGHGSMLLYALLHLTGYQDFDLDQIKRFRQLGSRTAGHPEYGSGAGIETTTGPLGQGLANAVGMALAERMLNARFGDDLVDHRTWVIAGDGCLMEGISHEAASLAGHLRLGNLIVLLDDNGISIDGPTGLALSDDYPARFAALGWHTVEIDGHDPEAIDAALNEAKGNARPSLVCCRTVIGFGAPSKGGTAGSHGAPLGADEIAGAREKLGWPHPTFEIPASVQQSWEVLGSRSREEREAWEARHMNAPAKVRSAFDDAFAGKLPATLEDVVRQTSENFAREGKAMATRQSSKAVLEALSSSIPALIGGSADLTGSNGTRPDGFKAVAPGSYGGRYVHWGARELGMAAAMNGLTLHGGWVPYSGSFLVFTDYARPAIRLAALMGIRVIHVMTHDSIGLGEDGPTHQPVEHLASLRAIPNLLVLRPCDSIETAECWQLALENATGPSVLSLSRQSLPPQRKAVTGNFCRRGGYVLRDVADAKVSLIASGSEVAVAVEAAVLLADSGVPARVVSLPAWELFIAQDESYRENVLGRDILRIGIEAAGGFGWERWLGPSGEFVGMSGFGASAPAGDLYKHFGITAERVAERVEKCLKKS